jgi:hypothetical protein
MKNTLPLLVLGAVGMTAAPLTAGELTGSASLDYNSHFISYGFDVWGGGDNPGSVATLNPAVSLNYQVDDKLSFNSGFWLDVNDNLGSFDTVETDTWIGVAYDAGLATYSATFQNWQYAGTSEEVLDLAVSFDTTLSPYIMLHNRLGEGASGGYNGTFLVLGGEHSFDVSECFSVTVPVAVGFVLDEFHTTESGYGYASIGLQGSYALTDSTSFNFGVTYYDTDDEVVGNDEDSFLTYNAGISLSF